MKTLKDKVKIRNGNKNQIQFSDCAKTQEKWYDMASAANEHDDDDDESNLKQGLVKDHLDGADPGLGGVEQPIIEKTVEDSAELVQSRTGT